MFLCIRKYILSCSTCQSRKEKDSTIGAHYPRIPLSFRPMSEISADVKHMPPSRLGYSYILLCTCEVSNYVVGIPIQDVTSVTLFEAIFFKIMCLFGNPKKLIFDEAKGLTSKVIMSLYASLGIKPFTISPQNHGSNRTDERYIRTMNDMVCKYLTDTEDKWPLFVYPCCYAMNTFVSPTTGYSPFEVVFLRKPPDITEFVVFHWKLLNI